MDRNRLGRAAAALTAAGLVAALAAGPAGANLKGCIRCIDAKDLARGSVTSRHVVDGSIQAIDMARGAAGGGGGVLELSGSTTSTAAARIASFAVTAPSAGVLLVTVSGVAQVASAQAAGVPITAVAFELGLCDTPDSFEACDGTHVVLKTDEPDNLGTNSVPVAFSLSRAVPVGAGPRAFHLNGLRAAPASTVSVGTAEGDDAGQTFVVAQFVPSALQIATIEPPPAAT
jgi:hypothetical protein